MKLELTCGSGGCTGGYYFFTHRKLRESGRLEYGRGSWAKVLTLMKTYKKAPFLTVLTLSTRGDSCCWLILAQTLSQIWPVHEAKRLGAPVPDSAQSSKFPTEPTPRKIMCWKMNYSIPLKCKSPVRRRTACAGRSSQLPILAADVTCQPREPEHTRTS